MSYSGECFKLWSEHAFDFECQDDCEYKTSSEMILSKLKGNFYDKRALRYLWKLCTSLYTNGCKTGQSGLMHACEIRIKKDCSVIVGNVIKKFCDWNSIYSICDTLKQTTLAPAAPIPAIAPPPLAPPPISQFPPPEAYTKPIEDTTKAKSNLLLYAGIGGVAVLLFFGFMIFIFCMMNSNKTPPPPPQTTVRRRRRKTRRKKKTGSKTSETKSKSKKVEVEKDPVSKKSKISKKPKTEQPEEHSSSKSKKPEEIV